MKYSNYIQDYSTGSQGPVLKKSQGWKTNTPLLSWTLCRSTVTPHIHIPHPVLPQRQRSVRLPLSTSSVCLCSRYYHRCPRQQPPLIGGHLDILFSTHPLSPLLSPCLPYIPAAITEGSMQKKTLCPPWLFAKIWAGIQGICYESCQTVCQRGLFNKSME